MSDRLEAAAETYVEAVATGVSIAVYDHDRRVTQDILAAADRADGSRGVRRVQIDDDTVAKVAQAIDDHYEEDAYEPVYNESGHIVTSAAARAALAALTEDRP